VANGGTGSAIAELCRFVIYTKQHWRGKDIYKCCYI
jgi:hypothetical protein